jgi:GNAT superfamily N-acetyltransferase
LGRVDDPWPPQASALIAGAWVASVSAPYAIVPLTEAHVPACCSLEARAFGHLRQAWGQAPQPERRQDCLAYYVKLFPQGAYGALAGGRIVGFCISHAWGSLGWIGPIAVDPEWQGQGIGRELTRPVVQALEDRQSVTIALETWPQHASNIQFYLESDFSLGPLVVVLEKAVSGEGTPFTGHRASEVPDRERCFQAMAGLADALHPGLDYTAPIRTTLDCGLGEVLFWGDSSKPEAVALLHTEPQHVTPPPEWAEVQLLMGRPGSEGSLGEWLRQLEGAASRSGRTGLRVSLSSRLREYLERLVRHEGYRVVKLRLRMYHGNGVVEPDHVNFISYGI